MNLTNNTPGVQYVVQGVDLTTSLMEFGRFMYEHGYLDSIRDKAALMQRETYTYEQVSEATGLSIRTLQNYVKSGKVETVSHGERGVRFTAEAVAKIKGLKQAFTKH